MTPPGKGRDRPFPKFVVAGASAVLVTSIVVASALAGAKPVSAMAAISFWLAALTLVAAPAFWLLSRWSDEASSRRLTEPVWAVPADADRSDAPPLPPGPGWSEPVPSGQLWYSYDARGRRRVLGPMGWTRSTWPPIPLTRFERKLRTALVGAAIAFVAAGCVPMAATIGPCAMVPCDRFPSDTATFTADGPGTRSLFVPSCLNDVRAIAIETYPPEGARQTLWSISAPGPAPLPEYIDLDQPPPPFQADTVLTNSLPVGEELWVEITTPTRRFISTTYVVDAMSGLVGSGEPNQTTSVDSFSETACQEVAYIEPKAPTIALAVFGIGYVGIPLLAIWLVVHHAIEKRRQGPPQPADPHAMSA